jgi:hypothetical protein
MKEEELEEFEEFFEENYRQHKHRPEIRLFARMGLLLCELVKLAIGPRTRVLHFKGIVTGPLGQKREMTMPFAIQISDIQNFDFEVTGEVDAAQNPVALDPTKPIAFAAKDPTQLAVTVDPTNANKINVKSLGKLTPSGTTAVVTVDSSDATPVHDEIAVTVVSSAAVGFAGTLGTPKP